MHKINNFIFDPTKLILYSDSVEKKLIDQNIPNVDDYLESRWRLEKIPKSSIINQELHLPTEGGICLTYKCQLHCEYCSFKSTKYSRYQIQQQDINQFINYLIKNIIILNFSTNEKKKLKISFSGGGEPTFDWDKLKATVEYIKGQCKKHNIEYELNITTNGVVSSAQAEYIVVNFKDAMISFDGLPALQNQNRSNKSFLSSDTVLNTLRVFDRSDIIYTIRSSVWQKDFHLLKNIAQFIYHEFNNFNTWSIMPVIPVGRAFEKNKRQSMFTYKENFVDYYFQTYEYIKSEFKKDNIKAPFINNDLVGIFCGAVYGEAPWLFPDNRILECLDAKEESPVLGEISEGKVKLKDNYHDTLFAVYREKFYECSDCLAYRFCKGGCPIKFLRKKTADYAAWECSMVEEYWRSLFRKLWTKKDEEYFGWYLEKIQISECPVADVYKLKKNN